MARSNLLDGFAYGVLNELLAGFRTDDGYAMPSRYEVILTPPASGTFLKSLEQQRIGEQKDVVRKVSMEMSQVAFPGMTLETQEDTNIYGPPRKIVVGQTFAELTTSIRVSQDFKERNFIDNWQRLAANRADFSIGYYDDYSPMPTK